MAANLDPFLLEPILVPRPWGGRRLSAYGKDLPAQGVVAESWEIADLPAEVAPHVASPSSLITTGALTGMSLGEAVRTRGDLILGDAAPAADGGFPLLIKMLDAREHLSVQVHPGVAYVAVHPETRLKTESWYIIEADPGSVLYLGVRNGVASRDVAQAIDEGRLPDLLNAVPAQKGSFHHLPAGIIHALGAGVVVAEVQTPSDTTFRMYDWNDEYGRPHRELHISEALESMVVDSAAAPSLGPTADRSRMLVEHDAYAIVEHHLAGGADLMIGRTTPTVVMVVEGSAQVGEHSLSSGATALIPASAPTVAVAGTPDATILEITVPIVAGA
ncbi:MAG: class I mannose-6-phosphate isomerase [Acidimicrobiia bacterium]|nr:class I mannose-6-phosphate isomerase [Acidimicrobiia bacterium]